MKVGMCTVLPSHNNVWCWTFNSEVQVEGLVTSYPCSAISLE